MVAWSAQLIREIIKDNDVIVRGHFVLTSGAHSNWYFNKDALYPDTEVISQLCLMMAQRCVEHRVEVVVAPEKGGIILSQWVAHHLTQLTNTKVLATYAEKNTKTTAHSNTFRFTRGYDQKIRGKRILVAEDVFTTGASARDVVRLVQENGGEVMGVTGICNRGNVTAKEVGNVPFFHTLLASSNFEDDKELHTWTQNCPLCLQNKPPHEQLGHQITNQSI